MIESAYYPAHGVYAGLNTSQDALERLAFLKAKDIELDKPLNEAILNKLDVVEENYTATIHVHKSGKSGKLIVDYIDVRLGE